MRMTNSISITLATGKGEENGVLWVSNKAFCKAMLLLWVRGGKRAFTQVLISFKIENEIDWKANTKFGEALEKTIYWYIDNQKWCKGVLEKASYFGERIGLNNQG